MRVTLTADELVHGVTNALAHWRNGLGVPHNPPRAAKGFWPELGMHVASTCAEIAAARALGAYWVPSLRPEHGGDLWDGHNRLEVRWPEPPNESLLIRERDPRDRFYVLVTGMPPTYDVHGLIRGYDAESIGREYNGNGRGPCWLIRADQLTHKLESASS